MDLLLIILKKKIDFFMKSIKILIAVKIVDLNENKKNYNIL